METLANGEEEATTAAYAAAISSVRTYAIAYKTAVAQRSVDTLTTDVSVFAAQSAWVRGLHATAVASGRYLVRWITPDPSARDSKPTLPGDEVWMVKRAFEDSLQAAVCLYSGFLEHTSLPAVLDNAVNEMEDNFAQATSSLDGLGVLLALGRLAVEDVKTHKALRVRAATLVYDMLSKLARAIDSARDHQFRYERPTWNTTILLLKTRLVQFDLAVAIAGLFVDEIRRYRDDSDYISPTTDDRSVKYGGWADTAREACWAVVDLMRGLVHEYDAAVITRVASSEQGSEAEDDEAMDENDDDFADEDDDEDDEASSDEETTDSGLQDTLLAQYLLTYERFRGVMEAVWDGPADFEVVFGNFLQPPVPRSLPTPLAAATSMSVVVKTEGDSDDVDQSGRGAAAATQIPEPSLHRGTTPARYPSIGLGRAKTASRSPSLAPAPADYDIDDELGRLWDGWDQLGLELCRQLSKSELAEFEEYNLDPGLHKRWRAELRRQEKGKAPVRSVSCSVFAEKRRADDDKVEEPGQAKRRRSDQGWC